MGVGVNSYNREDVRNEAGKFLASEALKRGLRIKPSKREVSGPQSLDLADISKTAEAFNETLLTPEQKTAKLKRIQREIETHGLADALEPEVG